MIINDLIKPFYISVTVHPCSSPRSFCLTAGRYWIPWTCWKTWTPWTLCKLNRSPPNCLDSLCFLLGIRSFLLVYCHCNGSNIPLYISRELLDPSDPLDPLVKMEQEEPVVRLVLLVALVRLVLLEPQDHLVTKDLPVLMVPL